MTKNQILKGNNPNSWIYIDSSGTHFEITSYNDYLINKYSIKPQNKSEHTQLTILNFWWEVIDYLNMLN